jgi:mannose-6-phosphate isomerase-like protein (cupin superfamily)/DNA-binding XRE family transcriptional regulator
VTPPDARIGGRLRAARQARGMTLDQVAAAAELTKGFLSRLERDEVSPSVASLVTVAGVLGIGMGELFDPPTTQLVRAGTGSPIAFGGQRVHETLLTPGGQRDLQVIHSRLDPGGTGGPDLYTLRSALEFVYVVVGALDVVLDGDVVALGAGDALTFPGRTPHTWRNGSDAEPAEVLWVLSPAP